MYKNARSRVAVNVTFNDFLIQVRLPQDSALSTLVFVILLEALSRSKELLYADDLTLVSETLEGLEGRLQLWKGRLESNGLRVNVKKTKVMISSVNAGEVSEKGKFPWAVFGKGVSSNFIFCKFCTCWVHKKSTDIRGKLQEDSKCKCQTCAN